MVSEVADQDFVIGLSKFKMTDTTWQLRVREKLKLCSKLVYGGFRSCWSRFCYQTFKIENKGFNITVKNSKKA